MPTLDVTMKLKSYDHLVEGTPVSVGGRYEERRKGVLVIEPFLDDSHVFVKVRYNDDGSVSTVRASSIWAQRSRKSLH